MQDFFITSLNNLIVPINLGVSDDERHKKQKIRICFKIFQPKDVSYLDDDNASNYPCYASISNEVIKFCQKNEFRLLEYLCFQIHKLIKQNINNDFKVYVLVEKLSVKIDSFECIAKSEFSDIETFV